MAGRTLSERNETKLRAALEAIGAVLASLVKDAEDAAEESAAEDAAGDPAVIEAGDLAGEFVPLLESAVRSDGTATLRIIGPGWGSSGYYPADVLRRDGPAIFTRGVKGYWDHATATEEAERPEGSLHNLASELITDARWQDNGPAGPGLYADAKIFSGYQEAVNELAPHIGVSIRAAGRTKQGEAEGRKGPIVEQLVSARSVDWVTVPGAGGRIVQMFEAARNGAQPTAMHIETQAINEGEQMAMDKEQEAKLLEAQAAFQKRIDALAAENARMREGLIFRDARETVRDTLQSATVPDVTRARLLEQLSANPPTTEAGALDRPALQTKVAEAVKAEQAYLAEAAGYGSGRIVGMGASGGGGEVVKVEDVSGKLKEAFGLMGLDEKEAAVAARGRGW